MKMTLGGGGLCFNILNFCDFSGGVGVFYSAKSDREFIVSRKLTRCFSTRGHGL